MNNIVTLSQLITRLAKITETDTNTARRFLRSFFASIEDCLLNNEDVTIKGIGTFRRSTDPNFGNESGIAFIPDKELAAEINAPFAAFEPEILAQGIEFDDELEDTSVVESVPQKPEVVEATEEVSIPETVKESEPEPAIMPEPEIVAKLEPEPKPVPEPEVEEDAEVVTPPIPFAEDIKEGLEGESEEFGSNKKIWLWVALIIILAIGIGYYAAIYETNDSSEVENTENADDTTGTPPIIEEISMEDMVLESENVDSTATETMKNIDTIPNQTEKQEEASSTVRHDTVTKSRFLATMAREYYGKSIYWVYIYEANSDRIANPNKIAPGTEVVIPDKSSFAAATEDETIRMAEMKLAEISKHFK